MEPVQPVQINIYPSNTYRDDLYWPYFDDEPRFQVRQQMRDQQSYMRVSLPYLTYPSNIRSTSPDMTREFYTKPDDGFIKMKNNLRRKKLHRTNQSSNFMGASFNNGDNARALIQFRRER